VWSRREADERRFDDGTRYNSRRAARQQASSLPPRNVISTATLSCTAQLPLLLLLLQLLLLQWQVLHDCSRVDNTGTCSRRVRAPRSTHPEQRIRSRPDSKRLSSACINYNFTSNDDIKWPSCAISDRRLPCDFSILNSSVVFIFVASILLMLLVYCMCCVLCLSFTCVYVYCCETCSASEVTAV